MPPLSPLEMGGRPMSVAAFTWDAGEVVYRRRDLGFVAARIYSPLYPVPRAHGVMMRRMLGIIGGIWFVDPYCCSTHCCVCC